MNPGRYDIQVYRGTTFSITPTWLIGTTPVIVTGYTAKIQVKVTTDSAVVLELSTANGSIVVNGLLGQFVITASVTQTLSLAAGAYVYDMNITDPTGVIVTKLLSGNFAVLPSVTT